MGAAASAGVKHGDFVQGLHCHTCGYKWTATFATTILNEADKSTTLQSAAASFSWTCSRCTLRNVEAESFCSACEAPRGECSSGGRICPSCKGEFVERIGFGMAQTPQVDESTLALLRRAARDAGENSLSVPELLLNMARFEREEDGCSKSEAPDVSSLSLALSMALARQLEAGLDLTQSQDAQRTVQIEEDLQRVSSTDDPDLARIDGTLHVVQQHSYHRTIFTACSLCCRHLLHADIRLCKYNPTNIEHLFCTRVPQPCTSQPHAACLRVPPTPPLLLHMRALSRLNVGTRAR